MSRNSISDILFGAGLAYLSAAIIEFTVADFVRTAAAFVSAFVCLALSWRYWSP